MPGAVKPGPLQGTCLWAQQTKIEAHIGVVRIRGERSLALGKLK
jgi:hypothetical protein